MSSSRDVIRFTPEQTKRLRELRDACVKCERRGKEVPLSQVSFRMGRRQSSMLVCVECLLGSEVMSKHPMLAVRYAGEPHANSGQLVPLADIVDKAGVKKKMVQKALKDLGDDVSILSSDGVKSVSAEDAAKILGHLKMVASEDAKEVTEEAEA